MFLVWAPDPVFRYSGWLEMRCTPAKSSCLFLAKILAVLAKIARFLTRKARILLRILILLQDSKMHITNQVQDIWQDCQGSYYLDQDCKIVNSKARNSMTNSSDYSVHGMFLIYNHAMLYIVLLFIHVRHFENLLMTNSRFIFTRQEFKIKATMALIIIWTCCGSMDYMHCMV